MYGLETLQETGKKKSGQNECCQDKNILTLSLNYGSSSKNPWSCIALILSQHNSSLDYPFLVNANVFPTAQPQFITQGFC